jgi:hypothetical protein
VEESVNCDHNTPTEQCQKNVACRVPEAIPARDWVNPRPCTLRLEKYYSALLRKLGEVLVLWLDRDPLHCTLM